MRDVLAFFILLAGVTAAAAALPDKPQHIARKTASHSIAIAYPRTGVATIDAEIAKWAKTEAAEFEAYVKGDRMDGSPWSLAITYKIVRNDAQMFEVLFSGQLADDGNHTHFKFTTFDYLMPGAHRVSIADVVTPAAYAKMRAFTVAHIVPEDTDYGAEVADDQALAPAAENFAAFTITPAAMTIWFTPDQLGNMTSAGGHVTIPLTELKGMIRANWNAPHP